MVAAAIVGAGALTAGASALSGHEAASAQKSAAAQANNTQTGMFNTLQENLNPYKDLGSGAVSTLKNRLTELTSPIVMDQAALEKTPGYQFQLKQGLKGIQNSASARGLGVSGRALKGAADYTTGLANSNYQQQFQNALTNQDNAYNRLFNVSSLGENAAAGVGNAALQTGQNIGNNLIGAGNAQAGSYIQTGNAIGSAANSIPNGFLTNKLVDIYAKNSGSGSDSEISPLAGGGSWATNPNTNWSSLLNG